MKVKDVIKRLEKFNQEAVLRLGGQKVKKSCLPVL